MQAQPPLHAPVAFAFAAHEPARAPFACVRSDSFQAGPAASSSSTTAPAAAAAVDVNLMDKGDGAVWNWAGSLRLHAQRERLAEPRTEAELCALLHDASAHLRSGSGNKAAAAGAGGIKVVGSRLASSALAAAADASPLARLVALTHFRGVLAFDADSITVGAGTQLGEIFSFLLDRARTLPCSPGVITYQTIGGAIASCTHGQGMYQSSLSDCVAGVRVALADGSMLTLDETTATTNSTVSIASPTSTAAAAAFKIAGGDLLNAFRASLGALGIVTAVRLRTAPAHVLRCRKERTDVDTLAANLGAWNERHMFFKNWWFPHTANGAGAGDVHLWRIDYCRDPPAEVKRKRWWPDGSFTEEMMRAAALPPPPPLSALPAPVALTERLSLASPPPASSSVNSAPAPSASSFSSSSSVAAIEHASRMRATIDATVSAMQTHTKDGDANASGAKSWTVKRFGDFNDVVGPIDAIVCKQVPPRQVNFELSVPLALASAAMAALRAWFSDPANAHLPVHYPVIMRCTGASRVWLSPAFGAPVCYFGFVVYMAVDGSMLPDSATYLESIQTILSQFEAKPHWGKFFTRSHYDFERLYPKFRTFAALKAALDPHGVFANPFLNSLFGDSGAQKQLKSAL